MKARPVCAELDRVYDSLWTFATTGGAEPTNNAVERARAQDELRNDSAQGSRFVERIRGVVESRRQHGRKLPAFLKHTIRAVRNNMPPHVLILSHP